MSLKKILYPGSFDPITYGHIDIIDRLSKNYDEVVVLISSSSQKKYVFDISEREELVKNIFSKNKKVQVHSWNGLLVDFIQKNKIQLIAKGLRNSRDFDYEVTMDHTNKSLYPEIDTLYLISKPEFSFISSTLVKEIATLGGGVDKFVPQVVAKALNKKMRSSYVD